MRDVAIVAAGMTRFGELWGASLRDLFVEAAREALTNAGAEHLDAIYVGNMSAGQFVGQEHLGPLLADHLGMAGVQAIRVESACASGGLALRQAWMDVASGLHDIVLDLEAAEGVFVGEVVVVGVVLDVLDTIQLGGQLFSRG